MVLTPVGPATAPDAFAPETSVLLRTVAAFTVASSAARTLPTGRVFARIMLLGLRCSGGRWRSVVCKRIVVHMPIDKFLDDGKSCDLYSLTHETEYGLSVSAVLFAIVETGPIQLNVHVRRGNRLIKASIYIYVVHNRIRL